jgi:hypothetical protein
MNGLFDLGTIVHLLLTLLWVGVLLIVAGLALLRFRTKPPGLLLGGAFGLWALQRLVVFFTSTFLPPMMDDPSGFLAAQALVLYLLGLVEVLAIGVGILLIPRALGEPSQR